jgi:hypothetical protein
MKTDIFPNNLNMRDRLISCSVIDPAFGGMQIGSQFIYSHQRICVISLLADFF